LYSFNNPPPAPVQKLKKTLDTRFAEHISIAESCRQAGYSHEALTRLFSKAYGISPGQYLLNKRIKHARNLLQKGETSIKEVASMSGFSCQNYFSRIFKNKSGITPKHYREAPDPLKGELDDLP
jgi:AraC-like DNA-binding protein